MPNGWQQTIKDWTIRRKILTGFAGVLALTAVLGWQAIRALDRLNGAGSDTAAAALIFQDSRTTILVVLVVTIGAKPCAHDGGGGRQHLGHSRSALRSLVADHHDVTLGDLFMFEAGEHRLFGVEHLGNTGESLAFLAGDLRH